MLVHQPLRDLDLHLAPEPPLFLFHDLQQHCPSLERFSLPPASADQPTILPAANAVLFAQFHPNLVELDLEGARCVLRQLDQVKRIAQSCPALRVLRLTLGNRP